MSEQRSPPPRRCPGGDSAALCLCGTPRAPQSVSGLRPFPTWCLLAVSNTRVTAALKFSVWWERFLRSFPCCRALLLRCELRTSLSVLPKAFLVFV